MRTIVIIALAAVGVAGCTQNRPTAYPLKPVPPRVAAACLTAALSHTFTVLCPTRLPRGVVWNWPGHPPSQFRVLVPREDPSYYHLIVMYGAPDERPGHARLNTPHRFLHFEMLGGQWKPDPTHRHTWLGAALELGTKSGSRLLQQPLGRRVLGGHAGRLYHGLPYAEGGGEFGDHLTFVWHEHGLAYGASLHGWVPRAQTLALLGRIIRTLAAPAPGPASGPTFIPASGWSTIETGSTTSPQAPSAVAASYPIDPGDAAGAVPTRTLAHITARGIVIQAALYPHSQVSHLDPAEHPRRALPLKLSDAIVRSRWEGAPRPGIPDYFIGARINGYGVEVHVYFGTLHPAERLRARAQRELNNLVIPPRG